MKKNTSWKFTDESSVTFQSSVSEAGEFGLIHTSSTLSYQMFVYTSKIKNSATTLPALSAHQSDELAQAPIMC